MMSSDQQGGVERTISVFRPTGTRTATSVVTFSNAAAAAGPASKRHGRRLDTADAARELTVIPFSHHNPLGYLIHFTKQEFPLPKEVLELTDMSFFGNYRWGSKADIRLKLPVRNPFGPVPGYYAKLAGPGTWHSAKPPPFDSG